MRPSQYVTMKFTGFTLGKWTIREKKYGLKYWNKFTSKTVRPNLIIRDWNDELMLGKVVKTATIGVGQQPCAQVNVSRNEFNSFLNMYFPNVSSFWALDDKQVAGTSKLCSLGDAVLIRKLTEPFTVKVTHRIESRVFEHGNIIDPVSGKRLFGSEYQDSRNVKADIVKQVFGQRLTARQLAAVRLAERKGLE